jgi:hypothetical protein
MVKGSSIVKVDTRHYRVIARENWGLTKEQMRGKHVHHRIKRSDGGTDDPTNLYVCSEWFHDNVWHEGEGGFAGCALLGAQKANEAKNEEGKSIAGVKGSAKAHEAKNAEGKSLTALKSHEKKDEKGRSLHALRLHSEKREDGKSVMAVENGFKIHQEKTEEGKSKHSTQIAHNLHKEKDELGRSKHALKALHSQKDEEGKSLTGKRIAQLTNSKIYRCLVTGKESTAGPLTLWQKARGIDLSLRVRIR